MKRSKYAYCDTCDDDVEYYVVDSTRTTTIDGVTFTYPIKEAHCKHCGDYVDPVSNTRENYILMSDAHKRALGLLTSVEIKEIRKKLHLSQTKLAKLIGVGEKNIARYKLAAAAFQQCSSFGNYICLRSRAKASANRRDSAICATVRAALGNFQICIGFAGETKPWHRRLLPIFWNT